MNPYDVEFSDEAQRAIERLSPTIAQRILSKLRWFAENRPLLIPEPLRGRFKGLFKLRVGDHRIIYELDDPRRLILVHLVGHRRDIYR